MMLPNIFGTFKARIIQSYAIPPFWNKNRGNRSKIDSFVECCVGTENKLSYSKYTGISPVFSANFETFFVKISTKTYIIFPGIPRYFSRESGLKKSREFPGGNPNSDYYEILICVVGVICG